MRVSDFQDAKRKFNMPESEPIDVLAVVSFRYFIPSKFLVKDEIKLAAVNAHPSLLPQYRGCAPIHHTLLNGDEKTGVSVIELSPSKMDIGSIIYQEEIDVGPEEVYSQLYTRLAALGGDMILKTIKNLPDNLLNKRDQVESSGSISYATKIKKDISKIDWSKDTSTQIYNRWRAIGDSYRVLCVTQDPFSQQPETVRLVFRNLQHPSKNNIDFLTKADHDWSHIPKHLSVLIHDKSTKTVYFKCNADSSWLGCKQLHFQCKGNVDANTFAASTFDKKDHIILE
ncbi:hypothetical protein AKO1_008147 [Acrasis kona]|uniref:Methionyl-tRNA formyltransferase n=1 Tax=Acrasis kona TaxID=1008807 RepID=A0AAW2YPM4_9EUKA